jgi:hypothetical protein
MLTGRAVVPVDRLSTFQNDVQTAVASPSIIPEHRPSHCQSSILIPPWEGSAANSSMSRSFRAAPAFCPLRFLDNLPHTLMKHI